jgi:uncharacterized membrane protein (GlpM family)
MHKSHRVEAINNIFCRRSRLIVAVILVLCLVGGMRHFWTEPQISLLVNEGGAEWIRFPKPFQLPIHWSESLSTSFRCRLDVQGTPEETVLTFRAMKKAVVYLDGRLIYRTSEDLKRWKEPHSLDLAPWLEKGKHELRIDVSNLNGHPTLLAYCKSLGVFSGKSWEASNEGREWIPALPVDQISHLPISRQFPRSDQAIRSLFPLLLSVFALFFFWSLLSDDRLSPSWFNKIHLSSGAVRWLILGGWLLMAINNFWKIPLTVGMDYEGHTKYIYYMADNWRIPLATEGWQMFQPPLFHFLAALVFRAFLPVFDPETIIRIMKLLPLLCGMAQIEICYRVLRFAYPERESLRVIGTLLGGLLPMNLYMSQSIGNEPLAGFLTALVVFFVCRILSGESRSLRKVSIFLGITFGFALLTKVTPVLIIPPVLLYACAEILKRSSATGNGTREVARFTILLTGIIFTVAGWYYLRNWTEMGRFFIGGWDSFREIAWWQDPGYRTPAQFYVFGESLFYPVFSSIYGFWDSIYSTFWLDGFLSANYDTPWNFSFMLSSTWLSLLPSAAIIIGVVVAFRNNEEPIRRILFFSITCVFIYLAAIFYMFLSVPILSSAKATYALGLIPCFALIGTAGFEVLTRQRFLRATVYGLFACWAVVAYASYLVI